MFFSGQRIGAVGLTLSDGVMAGWELESADDAYSTWRVERMCLVCGAAWLMTERISARHPGGLEAAVRDRDVAAEGAHECPAAADTVGPSPNLLETSTLKR